MCIVPSGSKSTERTPACAAFKAFTLVELLVVIGIIALLISILLPSLNKARASAANAACLSALRQMGQGLHFYANDNKNFLPYAIYESYDVAPGVQQERKWHHFLSVYLGKPRAVTQSTPGNGGEIAPVIDFGCKTFVASRDYGEGNNDPTSTSYTTGYGMIYYMKLPSAGDWGRSLNRSDYSGFRYNFQGPTREGTPPVKMTAIKRKDKQWVIGDSINYLMSPALWEGGAVHPESHGIWFWYAPGTAYQRRSGHVIFDKATKGSDPARHVGKQANYLFVDGHAESLNPYAALITLYPYEVER